MGGGFEVLLSRMWSLGLGIELVIRELIRNYEFGLVFFCNSCPELQILMEFEAHFVNLCFFFFPVYGVFMYNNALAFNLDWFINEKLGNNLFE